LIEDDVAEQLVGGGRLSKKERTGGGGGGGNANFGGSFATTSFIKRLGSRRVRFAS
jgi:hypothetical protein